MRPASWAGQCPRAQSAFADAYRRIYSRYERGRSCPVRELEAHRPRPQPPVELSTPGAAATRRRSQQGPQARLPTRGRRSARTGAVFDRYLLTGGQEIRGPAIVEERETTVESPVGSIAAVDRYGEPVVEL